MSAGDVLFVGWTGDDPQYKELPPQVQIEPAANPEFISKRVTLNRVCFDKDKQAVVQQLPTGDAVLSSVYVDTDGSAQSQTLGGGYTLLSVSDATIANGFSRISAVYEKTVLGIFEIGLPEGVSIACSNGACQIKYLSNVLEEIDSGTGKCSTGLEVSVISEPGWVRFRLLIGTFANAGGYRAYQATSGDGETVQEILYPATTPLYVPLRADGGTSRPDAVQYEADLVCNRVSSENIQLTGADLYDVKDRTFSGDVIATGELGELTDADLDEITQAAFESLKERVASNVEVLSCRHEKFFYNFFDTTRGSAAPVTETEYYRVIPTYRFTYADKTYEPQLEWTKDGNVIKLQYGRAIIREYDITGLT